MLKFNITYYIQFMKIIIAIVIVILLYYLATWNACANEDYLYGFWAADGDEFCERADIESMLLFVGEPDRGWISVSRTCYVVIMNDISNQGLVLEYKKGWAGPGISSYCIDATATFDGEQIWDENVKIQVDMRIGELKITGQDGTVYAILHKQHDTTNIARAAEGAELIDAPV